MDNIWLLPLMMRLELLIIIIINCTIKHINCNFILWSHSILSDVISNCIEKHQSYVNELRIKYNLTDFIEHTKEITNTNIFITGGTNGIGKALVENLKKQSNHLFCTTRSMNLTNDSNVYIDLSKSNSIDINFHQTISKPVDIIVLNAGIMKASNSSDIYLVNTYSPMLITLSLLPTLLKSTYIYPTICFITSSSHIKGEPYQTNINPWSNNRDRINIFESLKHYCNSKLYLMLANSALYRRIQSTDVRLINVHPGLVDTNMLSGFMKTLPFNVNLIPFRKYVLRSTNNSAKSIEQAITNAISNKIDILDNDFRRLYYVNGVSSSNRCDNKVNDYQTSEQIYNDILTSLSIPYRKQLITDYKNSINLLKSNKLCIHPTERKHRIHSLETIIYDIITIK